MTALPVVVLAPPAEGFGVQERLVRLHRKGAALRAGAASSAFADSPMHEKGTRKEA